LHVLHGDPVDESAAGAAVVVEATYTIGAREPGGSGPAAALALPLGGGLVLHTSSGWPQADRDQIAQCLNLTPPQLRLIPAGAAGPPPGALDVAVLACLLAGRTGRPVRLVDHREGVARAPAAGPAALLHYRHHADADGRLLAVQARVLLDAGAYAGVAATTLAALCTAAVGPYRVQHAEITGFALRTTNPPAPEPRGGGAAAACVAHEAQLDALAARLGLDPLELRARNVLDETDPLPTGQLVPGGAGVSALLNACADAPLPGRRRAYRRLELPGGAGRASERSALRRGVGFAAGMTPLLPGEGADPPATATVQYVDGRARVSCAAPELGQGFLSVAAQIVREVLGTAECELAPTDADAPSAGPAAASRLTWVAGGAVAAAARGVAHEICAGLAATRGVSANLLTARGGRVRSFDGLMDASLEELAAGRAFECTATFAPPPTEPLDSAGQGNAYAGFGFAAHRAVVDVDLDLGLVRVVDLTVAVDVGRVVNLVQLLGCVEGGTAAGVGLALLSEDSDGRGPLTADALDVPLPTVAELLENPQAGAPFGAKGVWDVTVGPAAAAVLAAVRDATGTAVRSTPVRPWDLTDPAEAAPA
jgi:CO/xanthine dehydrogenase Mo-binding subunit